MGHPFTTIALATLFMILVGCDTGDKSQDRSGGKTETSQDSDILNLAAPAGKLPTGTHPTAYRLDLLIDPRRDEFSGEVAIDIVLEAPTNRIWLHGKDLDVSEANVSTESGVELSGLYEQVLASGVSAISFDEELPAGNVTLNLRYSARFDRNTPRSSGSIAW